MHRMPMSVYAEVLWKFFGINAIYTTRSLIWLTNRSLIFWSPIIRIQTNRAPSVLHYKPYIFQQLSKIGATYNCTQY